MRTQPSGVRATASAADQHVARPVYGLQGTNLLRATESACRTCGVPIKRTTVDDGLRGSWRHTEAVAAISAPDLSAEVHEARERNLAKARADEALARILGEHRDELRGYDAAVKRLRPEGHQVLMPPPKNQQHRPRTRLA